jgi:hypothetical protein
MRRKQIETFVVICLFLVILGRVNRSWNEVYAAAGLALLGLAWKDFREAVHWLWMKLAEVMGLITGKILLTLIFILMVIPLSFFAKKRGKLNIRMKPGGASYFKELNHIYTQKDLENPW